MHGGAIESVSQSSYQKSVADVSERVDADVYRRISLASSAFGALRKSDLLDIDLNLASKMIVYQVYVLVYCLFSSLGQNPGRSLRDTLDD